MKSHSETNTPCNSQQLLKYIRGLKIKMNGISCFFFPSNPFIYGKKKVKVLLYPMPPFFCILEGSQALPTCLSGKNNTYMTMSMEQW